MFPYTPKQCSGVKQRAIGLRMLGRKRLTRGACTSVDALKANSLHCIAYYNRTLANPFKGTYQPKPRVAYLSGYFSRAVLCFGDSAWRGPERLQLDTLRRRRIKLGGRVQELFTHVKLQLASSHPGQHLWQLLATTQIRS